MDHLHQKNERHGWRSFFCAARTRTYSRRKKLKLTRSRYRLSVRAGVEYKGYTLVRAPRSCEAEMHQQGTSKTRSSDEGTPSGVSAGSCCPHHVAARRILKQLEFAQAVFFCACVSFSHKTRFAIFAGALKHERHGWRSFFVRQGRGAPAFTPFVTVSAFSRTP